MNSIRALEGRRALVTGGTRGIGLAISEKLAAAGAQVYVSGRSDSSPGASQFEFLPVDFSVSRDVDVFCERVASLAPDILVNNAGINRISPFDEIRSSDFLEILAVNLVAPFQICRAAVPGMKKAGWGRIVNITSIFSVVSKEYRAPYSASKFGLDGMTAALAAEVASAGILANCVAPGFIETELTRNVLGERGIEEMKARIPAKRLGKPEEIAELVLWLASPQNTYVSGQNFIIDGGFTRV